MDRERFVYDIASKEVNIAVGGKNFDLQGYDCVKKKFFHVLSIETDGPIVRVRLGECKENLIIYD